jgi:hypothetical protein
MIENVVVNIPAELVKKYEEPYTIYYTRDKSVGYDKIKEKLDFKVMLIKGKKVIQKRIW